MLKKSAIISYAVAIIVLGIFVMPSYAWLTFDSFPATERDELPQGPQDGEWVYSSQYANNTYINSTHGWCQRSGYYDNPIYFNWFKYYHNSYNNSHMGFETYGYTDISGTEFVKGHSLHIRVTGGMLENGQHGMPLFNKEEYLDRIVSGDDFIADYDGKLGSVKLYFQHNAGDYGNLNMPFSYSKNANALSFYI